ncbi:hypothetical protein ABZ345_10460 [Lentzea sp. NPDC005914]|uniref:hypothetical protein n=1 Tax=Lentzea sp. NPDC005914 TaxID=3154572 RepID=UPI0033EBC842
MIAEGTFDRPYLDLDVVGSLSESAGLIRHLLGFSDTLQELNLRLARAEGIAQTPHRSPPDLQSLAGHVSALNDSLKDARKIPDHAEALRDATEPLRGLLDSIPALRQFADSIQDLPDRTENLREATEPLRGLPESALAIQRSNEALAASHEEVQQLLASLSLFHPAVAS